LNISGSGDVSNAEGRRQNEEASTLATGKSPELAGPREMEVIHTVVKWNRG
jgi:hypothetical protein